MGITQQKAMITVASDRWGGRLQMAIEPFAKGLTLAINDGPVEFSPSAMTEADLANLREMAKSIVAWTRRPTVIRESNGHMAMLAVFAEQDRQTRLREMRAVLTEEELRWTELD